MWLFLGPKMASNGPFWASNRPPGGFRWPQVHDLRLPGGPKVHFEAKNLEFGPILDRISRDFFVDFLSSLTEALQQHRMCRSTLLRERQRAQDVHIELLSLLDPVRDPRTGPPAVAGPAVAVAVRWNPVGDSIRGRSSICTSCAVWLSGGEPSCTSCAVGGLRQEAQKSTKKSRKIHPKRGRKSRFFASKWTFGPPGRRKCST